jgi:hypothetical protein
MLCDLICPLAPHLHSWFIWVALLGNSGEGSWGPLSGHCLQGLFLGGRSCSTTWNFPESILALFNPCRQSRAVVTLVGFIKHFHSPLTFLIFFSLTFWGLYELVPSWACLSCQVSKHPSYTREFQELQRPYHLVFFTMGKPKHRKVKWLAQGHTAT